MIEIDHLSPSSINLFCSDYTSWYKQYILGEKIPDNMYFQVGTACHSFIEDFFTGDIKDMDISTYATTQFNILFKKYFSENYELLSFLGDEFSIDDIKEWLSNYIRVWVAETKRIEKKYGSQKAFLWNTPSVMEQVVANEDLKIKGRIDAIYTSDKLHKPSECLCNPLIVDFKTGSKQVGTIPTDYYIQLMIYAYLYKLSGNKVDWVAVDYIKYGQKYFFRCSDDAMDKINKLIADVWSEVNDIVELHNRGEDVSKYKRTTRIKDYI